MESQIIKAVLRRCRRDDIVPILKKWNALPDSVLDNLDMRHQKWLIASEVVEHCEAHDIDINSAGLLDLISVQLTSEKKNWEAHSIKISDDDETRFPSSDADEFNDELKALLCLYFGQVHTTMNIYAGFLWGRVHFVQSLPRKTATPVYQPNDVVYFVHPPHTKVLIITRMKVAFRDSLTRALQTLFATDQVRALKLSGHDVFSLVDLVLNKNCQASFGKFKHTDRGENPLQKRKRKRESEEEEEMELDARVVCENIAEKRTRRAYLDRIYGTHKAPTLEKLEYKMDVKFRGTDVVPAMADDPEPFQCRVKFEGPSVLEGLKNLSKNGLATTPLPKHITRVQSLAMNYIHIKENK